MARKEMTTIPVKTIELVAHLLRFAGEESAAALTELEPYSDLDPEMRERVAYDRVNEIDSALAAIEGYLAEYYGSEWNEFEARGLSRWEDMAG